MRKAYIVLPFMMTVILAGCLPQAQTTPTATSTAKATSAPTVIRAVPTQAATLLTSGCTVVTQKPTPGPTQPSIFPPVSDTEWVKGPASAKVTIIEYADFQ